MATSDPRAGSSVASAPRDDGWLRPTGHAPDTPAAWTRLGTLDGPGEPIVDRCGVVQVAPGWPGVTWWIAGDDRWYFPSREKTVRQSLFHNTPVVETRVRVKGGDVCLRTYAATVPGSGGLRDVVVMEVENATGVPCGVAFAVRPFGVVEDSPVHRLTIDGGVVRADGRPVLLLPRAPAGALGGAGSGGDLADRVRRGEATGASFAPVECPDGRAQAVVVVPLAHRNVFRVVLPVPDPDGTLDAAAGSYPGAVPPAENVARGWRAQVRDQARFSVPDPRLQAVCDSAAPWLSATTNHAGAATGRSVWEPGVAPRWQAVAATAGALDRLGLHGRAGTLLARAAMARSDERDGDASWLVEAFAGHTARTGDRRFAEAVLDVCADIVAQVTAHRGPKMPAARRLRVLEAARSLFTFAGQASAADAVARAAAAVDDPGSIAVQGASRGDELWEARIAAGRGDGFSAWAVLDRYLDDVSSTGVWASDGDSGLDRHSVGVTAAVMCLVCDLLVSTHDGRLRLLAHMPGTWSGRSLEVTGVSTASGSVGYAVRWHGERPAVLWELAPGAPGRTVPDDLAVSAPGLDPAWHAAGATGEALLGSVGSPVAGPASGSRISGLQIGRSRGGS